MMTVTRIEWRPSVHLGRRYLIFVSIILRVRNMFELVNDKISSMEVLFLWC